MTQAKYTSNLLCWAGLIDHKIVDTSIKLNVCLTHSLGEPRSNTTLYQQLVGSLHQVCKFMFATRSTHYDTVLFFDILRAPFSTLWTFLFSLLFCKPTLMLIGQEIPPIDGPLLDIASSFTPIWSLKKAKSSLVSQF